MATFDVFNLEREKVGSIDLADEVFGTEVREHLFYEVVKAQLASKRQGTQAAKNRSAVSGSTKKLYK
jgi:large subunit ribosomal protein L4